VIYHKLGRTDTHLLRLLDTLWIMGMKVEFEEAVKAVNKIDFSTCALEEINVFETTIRYLGGFLSAYDISNQKYPALLQKAQEMGTMLYKAFDTPNRMPITRWKFRAAAQGIPQEAPENILLAEIGSLTLEFTRLSQLTSDPRYYDAVQRIMDILDSQQATGRLPGLWPVVVNAKEERFNEYGGFTIGGMADSTYEYLPKVCFTQILIC
jgi:mannosyl-oligosaccharide alpha-1,2-mannosidase